MGPLSFCAAVPASLAARRRRQMGRSRKWSAVFCKPNGQGVSGDDDQHLSDVLPVVRETGTEEDHDEISADRSSGGVVGGRSHDGHGSKWPSHWRISTSAVEPKSLWPLRLPSSLLRPPSSLLRLLSSLPPSSALVSLLIAHDQAGVQFLNGSRRREAARLPGRGFLFRLSATTLAALRYSQRSAAP